MGRAHYPQKDPHLNWKGKARQNVRPESFVHRIGHLIVLPPGINSRAGTSRFADKVAIYKEVAACITSGRSSS
ncbi:MAG: HNH endonuclease family protein [Bryobacteraceae bacterium]|nr:HNH endonuclease family protein [Bryobacteraceae bacterium]